MANYNANGLKRFVSKKLEQGPNTSIDWIVYQAKGNRIQVNVLTVCRDINYPFYILNDKEIEVNGIKNELLKIFEPYKSQTTPVKYGRNKKTLEQSIVSKEKYLEIIEQKEKEEKQKKESKEKFEELKKEYDAQQRIILQQVGSLIK